MPCQESFDIVAFRSRQHAFHFSQVLRQEGYAVQVMSTPKEVALGCGLSVRYSHYMRPQVLRILKRYNKPIQGVYHVLREGASSAVSRVRYAYDTVDWHG